MLDVSVSELPATSWNVAHNVSVVQGAFTAVWGDREFLTDLDFEPWTLTYVGRSLELPVWLLLGETQASLVINATVYDITNGLAFRADKERGWNVSVMSDLVIITNGIDRPMMLPSLAPQAGLVLLPNWPQDYRADCFFGFKQHVFAFNVLKDRTRFETMVKWSHPADPGYAPAHWEIDDPTLDGGEYVLSESPGAILAALPLRDSLVIYKQDSIWAAQFIGGIFIWKFTKLFEGIGVQNARSVLEFDSGRHIVFTGTDLIVHDGQSFNSIARGRVRTLLQGFDLFQLRTSFLAHNSAQTEVWFCYGPRGDREFEPRINAALVWNYTTNAFTTRDLDSYADAASGQSNLPPEALEPWDEADKIWRAANVRWGFSSTKPVAERLLAVKDNRVLWVGEGTAGEFRGSLERTHLGVPMLSNAPPDLTLRKFLSRLWPRISGRPGAVFSIQLGIVDDVQSPIKWARAATYTLGKTTSVPCLLTGKMFAVRIRALTDGAWKLDGIDVEIKPAGRW